MGAHEWRVWRRGTRTTVRLLSSQGCTRRDDERPPLCRSPGPLCPCTQTAPQAQSRGPAGAGEGRAPCQGGDPPPLTCPLSLPPPRIVPAGSRHLLLKHLVPSVEYDLCVLAIFDDAATSLAATHLLGCAQFATREAYPDCRSLHAHFLGGTLTVIVGGVIVATLLVFTVVMMVKYKVCGSARGEGLPPKVTHVCSQTNGGGPPNGLLPQRTPPKERGPKHRRARGAKAARPEGTAGRRTGEGAAAAAWGAPAKTKRSSSLDMGDVGPSSSACYGYAKRLSLIWTKRSQSVHGMLVQCAAPERLGPFLDADELEESVV